MTLLNRAKVEQLSEEIGSENVPMLLDIFIGELAGYQTKLKTLEGDEQIRQLKEISHALKSSAASFGADRLCELAQNIDKLGKQQASLTFVVEGKALCDVMANTEKEYSEYRESVVA